MTKSTAKELIKRYKSETNYFSGNLKLGDMKEMFRNRMQFGEAETEVILAALIIAGAQFQDDEKREVSEAWKKEMARKAKRAKYLGEEMDRAVEAGDDRAFAVAYRETRDCMKASDRDAYWKKYIDAWKARRRT